MYVLEYELVSDDKKRAMMIGGSYIWLFKSFFLSAVDYYLQYSIQDLDGAIKRSTAAWKVAVGHHTMRSVSDHGDTKELLQLLLPVLQVLQYNSKQASSAPSLSSQVL